MEVGGIAKAAGEMIPKAVEAYSRVFPGTAMRSAQNAGSHAVHSMMEDLSSVRRLAEESELTPDLQRALVNAVFQQHGSDQRVDECFAFAEPKIKEDSHPEDLDPEWVDYWRMHAGMVREETVQEIWGAILAEQVNTPGAVSKRAMSILADMDKREADDFALVCSLCVDDDDSLNDGPIHPIPVVYRDEQGDTYNNGLISYWQISRLDKHGLLDTGASFKYRGGRSRFRIGEKVYSVELKYRGTQRDFSMGTVEFTDEGKELARLLERGSHPDLLKFVADRAKRLGFKLQEVPQ